MILDTGALMAFVDGDAAVGDVLRRQSRAAIPAIVLGEFRLGIAASKHREAYEAWLRDHLRYFDVLPITEETTVLYAELRVELKRTGEPIPANDTWIAALALEHKLPILSRDKTFDAVRGISRADW